MLATSAKSYKTHLIRFVFDLAILDHILLIFGPKLALYIYIGNTVPGNNPAARFSSPFYEYTELEAYGPLVGKLLSIAIR